MNPTETYITRKEFLRELRIHLEQSFDDAMARRRAMKKAESITYR